MIKILVLLVILVGCSRPPKVLQPQAKVNADATLTLAQRLEQKGAWWESRQSYRVAQGLYQSFGDLVGQLYCKSGLARVAFQNSEMDEYQNLHDDIADYLGLVPESDYILLLLELYAFKNLQNYEAISELAIDAYEYPLPVRIQILAHRLQAISYLQPGYQSAVYGDLKRLAGRYQAQMKKDFSADATVLSLAEYAMAYHKYLAKEYRSSLKHIEKAIDLDYRYENFEALAASHRLQGRLLEKFDEPEAALVAYYRAYEIYLQQKNQPLQDEVLEGIKRLQGQQ